MIIVMQDTIIMCHKKGVQINKGELKQTRSGYKYLVL